MRLSFLGLKSLGTGGRSQVWSFSVLFCFRSEMSWLSFSRTSLSNVLFGWLDPSLFLGSFWELLRRPAGDEEKPSSRRFLEFDGEAGMLRRVLEASPKTRFFGNTVEAIVTTVGDGLKGNKLLSVKSAWPEYHAACIVSPDRSDLNANMCMSVGWREQEVGCWRIRRQSGTRRCYVT